MPILPTPLNRFLAKRQKHVTRERHDSANELNGQPVKRASHFDLYVCRSGHSQRPFLRNFPEQVHRTRSLMYGLNLEFGADNADYDEAFRREKVLREPSYESMFYENGAAGHAITSKSGSEAVTATFDLFDSSSGPDLTLSPQTFTNSAEAFINDNSDSLGGVPQDQDAG
ncbi:hypothetical protein WA026_002963 [Henosepilachna vigintioctopunctata]|uniref:Uncharacterized protein n=1 Tax=Henosepilachna vigintioctopunctata TaxID=420089 RepID=A0AAW1TM45_9CUCU